MDTLFPAIVQVVVFLVLLIIITKYLGTFMAQVFEGQRNFLSPVLAPVERGIYRLFRINPKREQTCLAYTSAMLGFSVVGLLLTYLQQRAQQWLPLNPQGLGVVGLLLTYLQQRVQQWLPLNPQGLGAVSPDSSFIQHGGVVCHQHQLAGLRA